MDRRHFFKTLLLAPFLGPLLENCHPLNHQSLIYMIADNPQDFLWIVLQELEKCLHIEEKNFSLSSSSPLGQSVIESLRKIGWKYVLDSSSATSVISFHPLFHPADPSFTLIKEGNIVDVRLHRLASLWKFMRKNRPSSSLMTEVALGNKKTFFPSAQWVSVYGDGKRMDRLSLRKNLQKTYHTYAGQVDLGIKDGTVRVLDSSCRNKICCLTSPASLSGETIICAPNRFLLKIERSQYVDTSIG